MSSKIFPDLFSFDEESTVEHKPLDLEVVRKNVPTYDSTKLCEMIVCDRYFGCYREIALMCMEELARRRIAGDAFDFETHIETSLASLPKLNFATTDIRDVLRQMVNGKLVK